MNKIVNALLSLSRPEDPADCLDAMLAKLRRQPRVVGRIHAEQAVAAAFLLGFGAGCDECHPADVTCDTMIEDGDGV